MPWKNPRCAKCGGGTKQGEIVDAEKCFYVCRYCGDKQIGWRHKKKTREDRLREAERDREWRSRQLPLKSPCVKGRRRHYFREPKTRTLTPDLRCKYCGKTAAQVKAEQRGEFQTKFFEKAMKEKLKKQETS